MDMLFEELACSRMSWFFVLSPLGLPWLGGLLKFKLVGADIRLLYFVFVAVLSFDDIDVSEDIEVVDIFEGYGYEPWLTPWAAEDSVISDEVEEDDDSGRGYIEPFSCKLMWCNEFWPLTSTDEAIGLISVIWLESIDRIYLLYHTRYKI